MLKSEKELMGFYRDKISAESKTLEGLPAQRDTGFPPDTAARKAKKRTSRTELVSALVAVAFAGLCFALMPVYPYRHFDRSMQIFSEIKIEEQQLIEFAQAVSLSFASRYKNKGVSSW